MCYLPTRSPTPPLEVLAFVTLSISALVSSVGVEAPMPKKAVANKQTTRTFILNMNAVPDGWMRIVDAKSAYMKTNGLLL